jgi:hypothetical protein
MKTLLISIFLLLTIYTFGQVSLPDEVSAVETETDKIDFKTLDIKSFVINYVQINMNQWLAIDSIKKLVNDTKNKDSLQLSKCYEFANQSIDTLEKKYNETINWEKLSIQEYDSTCSCFLIKSDQLGDFLLPVSKSASSTLKKNWSEVQYSNQEYALVDGKFVLINLTIKDPKARRKYSYKHDIKTNFTVENLDFDIPGSENTDQKK